MPRPARRRPSDDGGGRDDDGLRSASTLEELASALGPLRGEVSLAGDSAANAARLAIADPLTVIDGLGGAGPLDAHQAETVLRVALDQGRLAELQGALQQAVIAWLRDDPSTADFADVSVDLGERAQDVSERLRRWQDLKADLVEDRRQLLDANGRDEQAVLAGTVVRLFDAADAAAPDAEAVRVLDAFAAAEPVPLPRPMVELAADDELGDEEVAALADLARGVAPINELVRSAVDAYLLAT